MFQSFFCRLAFYERKNVFLSQDMLVTDVSKHYALQVTMNIFPTNSPFNHCISVYPRQREVKQNNESRPQFGTGNLFIKKTHKTGSEEVRRWFWLNKFPAPICGLLFWRWRILVNPNHLWRISDKPHVIVSVRSKSDEISWNKITRKILYTTCTVSVHFLASQIKLFFI